MTEFLALPEECAAWLEVVRARLGLTVHDRPYAGGPRMSLLWPDGEPAPVTPAGEAWSDGGVQVVHPHATTTTLKVGWTGWKGSAFEPGAAATGRRLSRSLTRSLRGIAPVPLFAMSRDGTAISPRPAAWGTDAAVASGLTLLQLGEHGARYVTADVRPRSSPLPPPDDRSLYEGDGTGRRRT